MDRTEYLALMAEHGRTCAADVLATGRHPDLARRMLALVRACELEGAVRQGATQNDWAVSEPGATEATQP
jgi:hypothetical protein